MKTRLMLLALPLLCCAACAPSTDGEETTTPETPYVAKSVVGVHLLSTDRNYEGLPEALNEEFVRNTFKISEKTEITMHPEADGLEYHWGKNHVVVKMAGEKPFASIFTAEYTFDKQFAADKAAPAETVAAVDSLDNAPEPANARVEPVTGLGDKAMWEPTTETLHVLFVNHILHLKVETADSEAVKKQRAVTMAEVLLSEMTGLEAGPKAK